MGNEGANLEGHLDVLAFFSRGGSLYCQETGRQHQSRREERCFKSGGTGFSNRLEGSGGTVMNLGTRGNTAQTRNLDIGKQLKHRPMPAS